MENDLLAELIIRRGDGTVVLRYAFDALGHFLWEAPTPDLKIAVPSGRRLSAFSYTSKVENYR